MSTIATALIQMRSGIDPAANLAMACDLIRQAAAQGASLIATPETTHLVQKVADQAFAVMRSQADDPAIPAFPLWRRSSGSRS